MKTTMKMKLTGIVTVAAIATSLAACSNSPAKTASCSLPEGPNLEQAISKARFDLETGCEHEFDAYFQRLLTLSLIHI